MRSQRRRGGRRRDGVGALVAVARGVVGVVVVLLVPWKSMIVRRGLRRGRRSRWASLLLAALARSAHPHRTDLSRRTLLRAGTLGAAAAVVYVAITAVVRAAGLPGATRRFTGSYEAGPFDPAGMPTMSCIDDVAPEVDPATWRLVVADADGERELSLQGPVAPRCRSGTGFPARLVAPGRRGFWWVKCVDRIELRSVPWWWQPPFPSREKGRRRRPCGRPA